LFEQLPRDDLVAAMAEVDAIARPHDARPYAELRTRWRRARRQRRGLPVPAPMPALPPAASGRAPQGDGPGVPLERPECDVFAGTTGGSSRANAGEDPPAISTAAPGAVAQVNDPAANGGTPMVKMRGHPNRSLSAPPGGSAQRKQEHPFGLGCRVGQH
jgi:hypothetical protein